MKPDHIVVHYDEIALKGANRSYFEKMLIENIKTKMGKLMDSYSRESGQITIILSKNTNHEKAVDILKRISGIAYISPAIKTTINIEKIKQAALDSVKNKEFSTFKIDTKRHNKKFKLNSREIDNIIGDEIRTMLHKKAKMKNPDLTLKIEITNNSAYLSYENIEGVGGIPIKRKQKVVTLLSGGFDSPVASYLMMKRGCEVILVHFQNENLVKQSVEDKIHKLAKQLSKYQLKTKLYIVPFESLQKEIIMKVPAKQRMLIYRRFMIKISEEIAKQEKAFFLVTGDSLSQVASQTIENLYATYANTEKHILTPLIGLDKKEIIAISRKIGTHDISKLQYCDVCSYFLPKGPELKARPRQIIELESKVDDSLIEDAIKKSKIKEY